MNHPAMRRKDRVLEEHELDQILANGEWGVLATVSPDGSPYCLPISYVAQSEIIYLHCAPRGRKLDNMLQNDRVCFTVTGDTHILPDQFTTLYESVIAFGRAQLIEDPAEKTAALLLMSQKYSPQYLDEAERYIERSLHKTAIIKITVEYITGKANKKL